MTEKLLSNNQAVVAGEIISGFTFSHEVFGEGFYMVDVLVSRLSDTYDTIPLMISDRIIDIEEDCIGRRVESDYIPCICWGRNARFAGKLSVGSHVAIWGRIQSREYQKKIGNDQVISKTAYEVSVSKMECLESEVVHEDAVE